MKCSQAKRSSRSSPWYTPKLRELKRYCKKLERKWRIEYSPLSKTTYREAIKIYKDEIKAAQAIFYEEKIKAAASAPKEIYCIAKTLLKLPQKPPNIIDAQIRCNNLAEFFLHKIQSIYTSFPLSQCAPASSPSTSPGSVPTANLGSFPSLDSNMLISFMHKVKSGSPHDPAPPRALLPAIDNIFPVTLDLLNASISSGTVPPSWKHAMARAILKKPTLDQDNPSNYRPISLLPWLSKILEKHINETLVEFLETNHLLDLSQIGFCPSTEPRLPSSQ